MVRTSRYLSYTTDLALYIVSLLFCFRGTLTERADEAWSAQDDLSISISHDLFSHTQIFRSVRGVLSMEFVSCDSEKSDRQISLL